MTDNTDSRFDGSTPALAGETTVVRAVARWYYRETRSLIEGFAARTPRGATPLLFGAAVVLMAAVEPAFAQQKLGDVYCGTAVQTGINVLFGLLAGLGLPVTMFFTGRSGLQYMMAGGNPKRKNEAKESLIMSAVGFSLIVGAILLPGFISKIGNQFGFSFSSCVAPY